jgi:hypothetical protein
VGWDGGTLRVICLVVSAVSAGYLWRAALEGDSELGRLLDTSPPATVSRDGPPTRPAPSLDRVLAAKPRVGAPADPAGPKPVVRRQKRAKSVLVVNRPARTVPKPSSTRSGGEAAPKKQPPKRPKPSPGVGGKTGTPKIPGDPREQTPTQESGQTGASAPATEDTPTSLTPEPTEPPSLLPTPEPEETPPTTQALVRPGWGHGDGNHAHAGPPGQAKKDGPLG